MREMPFPLLMAWFEYYKRDPFGGERGDLQTGILASTLANIHSPKKRLNPRDFMPKFYEPPQSMDDMAAQFKAAALAAKAIKDKGKI